MSDKRSVATDALETLGTIIDDTAKRDAIHLAVLPAIAGVVLPPGMHISVIDGVAMPAIPGDGIGIVDPFLMAPVKKGQRFWLVMYPRTITSLRHVWSHPAFPDEPAVHAESDDDVQPAIKTLRDQQAKAKSEQWLRDFCDHADCPSYEEVIGVVASGRSAEWDNLGEWLHFDGSDAHGEIPEEFWDHAEVVLGRKIESRPTHFSCSC